MSETLRDEFKNQQCLSNCHSTDRKLYSSNPAATPDEQ